MDFQCPKDVRIKETFPRHLQRSSLASIIEGVKKTRGPDASIPS
jgi:hypothetical protein